MYTIESKFEPPLPNFPTIFITKIYNYIVFKSLAIEIKLDVKAARAIPAARALVQVGWRGLGWKLLP